jgi:antitoxin component of MazEF toxin-antitoxin module
MLTGHIAAITSDEALETLDEARERLVSPAAVLISEQEVVLGTAVALRARPKTRRRWFEAINLLRGAMQRTLTPSTQEGRPVRREYPKRYAFLENACMAREMDRL